MYIRPRCKCTSCYCYNVLCPEEKCYHTDLLLLGSRLFKNTVLFCTKKKSHITFKDGKALASVVINLSPTLSTHYA